nr:putative integron gene cassette protein [uncultured bacterium]
MLDERASEASFEPFSYEEWASALMHNGDNPDKIFSHRIEESERKALEDSPPQPHTKCRRGLRELRDLSRRGFNLRDELLAKAWCLRFVLSCVTRNLARCEGRELNGRHFRRLRASANTSLAGTAWTSPLSSWRSLSSASSSQRRSISSFDRRWLLSRLSMSRRASRARC